MKNNLTKKSVKRVKPVKHLKRIKTHKNKFMKITKKKSQKSSKKKDKKNKSRKTKKGGLRKIEEGNFSKNNFRVKRQVDYYKTMQINSCDNISNSNDLINKLETNFVKRNNLSIYSNTFTLFPYCNENLKGPEIIDRVNMAYTSMDALQSFNKVFQAQFTAIQPAIITENGALSSENNPKSFVDLLKTIPNNIFIVSHSGIMIKIYDYILKNESKTLIEKQDDKSSFTAESINTGELEKLFMDQGVSGGGILSNIGLKSKKQNRDYGVFDNLDILQLIFDKQSNVLRYMIVRRYSKKYKINNEVLFNNKHSKSVFIMRHCLGCHNITPGLTVKTGQSLKQIREGTNLGYLDWSMCFENTVDEMKSTSNSLYNILDKYGGMESYIFGSSVIFRAILTSILIFNLLKSEEEASTSSVEDILSGMKEPVDPESP